MKKVMKKGSKGGSSKETEGLKAGKPFPNKAFLNCSHTCLDMFVIVFFSAASLKGFCYY
jgi:hypothetical protein